MRGANMLKKNDMSRICTHKMEATSLIHVNQTTRRHIPEDPDVYIHTVGTLSQSFAFFCLFGCVWQRNGIVLLYIE
jgi:hypothetical protein